MGKVINVKFKTSKRSLKDRISYKFNEIKIWMLQHPELVIAAIPVVVKTGSEIVKFAATKNVQRKEQQLKEFYCYDRSLGHYWKLRRELSNDEWVEIDKRKVNGERLGDILDSMKVLK